MAFSISQWRDEVQQHFAYFVADPKGSLARAGITSVYGFLLGSTMLPVINAYASDPASTLAVLASVVGSIGGNLLANLAEKRYVSLTPHAILAEDTVRDKYAEEFGAIAKKLDVFPTAEHLLHDAGQIATLEALRKELQQRELLGQFANTHIQVEQSGGVNFGIGNTIGETGDIVHGDKNAGNTYLSIGPQVQAPITSGRDTNIRTNVTPSQKRKQSAPPVRVRRAAPSSSQREAGEIQDIDNDRDHIQKLLSEHTRRLHTLELRAAKTGNDTPADVVNEIEDLRQKIRHLRHFLVS
jgi:hypothetical protein